MNEALDIADATFQAIYYDQSGPTLDDQKRANRVFREVKRWQPFIYEESAAWLAA